MTVLRSTITVERNEEWRGPKRWLRLAVYETGQELREAAGKYRPQFKFQDTMMGCYQGAGFYVDDTGKRKTRSLYTGIIRLTTEHLHSEVVFHECVHAAAHIYRLDCYPRISLGDGFGAILNEEMFAYIAGDLGRQATNALYDLGVWK